MPPELAAGPAAEPCWCCGAGDDPALMVRLGHHPEVALCRDCARWAAKQAAAIDDRGRTGPAVLVRDRMRRLRQLVIERGWHRHRLLGAPLRRLGRYVP